ncbi:membrane protein [Beggiatoa sp. PS]|nr:membrane protein [Beggiatoa sp. PS]
MYLIVLGNAITGFFYSKKYFKKPLFLFVMLAMFLTRFFARFAVFFLVFLTTLAMLFARFFVVFAFFLELFDFMSMLEFFVHGFQCFILLMALFDVFSVVHKTGIESLLGGFLKQRIRQIRILIFDSPPFLFMVFATLFDNSP